jgi:hypothetical protein
MCEGKSVRQIAATSVFFFVSALACSLVVAEEQGESAEDESVASIEALMSAPAYDITLQYTSAWPGHPLGAGQINYPMDDVSFRDGSKLGRLKSIRQLSILTFTDNGSSRLYLGVNEEGIFGIHMSFLARKHSDRFAEVLRMPYLRRAKDQP